MMKNGWKLSLLIIGSAMLLTACGNGKTEARNEDVQKEDVQKVGENTGEIRESITAIDEVYQEKDAPDVNYDWWQDKYYISKETGGTFYGFRYNDGGKPYFMFGTCCVSIDSAEIEILEDDYFGQVIGYTFQTQMRRGNSIVSDEYYVLYYVERDSVDVSNSSATYSDKFDYDSTYQTEESEAETSFGIEGESTNNDANYFYDGQRFKCFETKSGEDMILTIRLFYDSDENGNMISDIPSMYKGVLNNGVEFWFEYYEDTSEYITYEVNCDDGSTAYLKYNFLTSEIELFTDNGLLNDCGGSYIALPDSSEG